MKMKVENNESENRTHERNESLLGQADVFHRHRTSQVGSSSLELKATSATYVSSPGSDEERLSFRCLLYSTYMPNMILFKRNSPVILKTLLLYTFFKKSHCSVGSQPFMVYHVLFESPVPWSTPPPHITLF